MKQPKKKAITSYYLSQKKRTELYAALANPITDLRIDILKNKYHSSDIEAKLFQLKQAQWKSISQILKIKNP